jgi:hypothetical protein
MDCGLELAPYQTIFVLQMVEKPVVQTVLAADANVEKVPAEPAWDAKKMSRPVLQILMAMIAA